MSHVSTKESEPVQAQDEIEADRNTAGLAESEAPVAPELMAQTEAMTESGPPAPATEIASPLVHVAPNLVELTIGRAETPEEKKEAKEQHDVNEIVHGMLIIGLAMSTALMLVGVVLDIVRRQGLPTAEPAAGDVFAAVLAFRPSGFLALGLIVLLATPILRVLGSVFAFAYERDWRYAGITFLVLMVVMASIVLGKG